MKTFYTLTNTDNHHTNSKSARFDTLEEAYLAAEHRIADNKAEGVIILKAIKLVRLAPPALPQCLCEDIAD